jgi:hypothetical protein
MKGLSALTLAKNRTPHLRQMLEGFRRSAVAPDELVIVDMDQTPPALPGCAFPIRRLHLPLEALPLAKARNLAAAAAGFDSLLFLDADCIPMRGLVGAVQRHLASQDILICPEIRYLGRNDARSGWDEPALRQTALPHPVRAFPEHGLKFCDNPGLFWSLGFGIRRERFLKLGGFDERFTGYGAEDTDFGFRARQSGLGFAFLGGVASGIGAFHQHHPVYDPPLQHFSDILRNAQAFHDRWNFWPMQGWLEDFEKLGLIIRTGGALTLRRQPTTRERDDAKSVDRRF